MYTMIYHLTDINLDVLILFTIIIVISIASKLLGCGLPATIYLRNKSKAMPVGIGMISRGKVRVIVAGIMVTSSSLSSNIKYLQDSNHYVSCNHINHSCVVK